MRLRPSTSLACASGLAFAVVVWSPGAMANGCDPTPSIGQTIVCDADATITVPDGAKVARVVVIGGGGGSGQSNSSVASGEGGNGAYVSADLRLTSTTDLSIVVGAGGSGGSYSSAGGKGGQYSAVFTGDTPLIIAGGGGAGSSATQGSAAGGSGAALGSAAGGDGEAVIGTESGRISGGSGGNSDGSGNGGSSGGGLTDLPDGSGDGSDWDAGGSGGDPVTGGTHAWGDGGSGYGGGGAGGTAADGLSYPLGGFAGGGAGGSYASNSIASNVVFRALTVDPGDSSAGAGGGAATDALGNPGRAGSVTVTFFVVVPTPSTGSSSVAPRAINLSFTLPSGFECRFGSVEASIGSWIELPAASDCTVTPRAGDTSENSTLLGWATSADFPVEIAQRQIDNGWGAYETYNDDGQMTSVFIPAGGFTAISGPTNLFPIMK